MESICKNCDTQLQTHYKFCPECSQNTRLHRLTLHDILHDAIHYFTHADKGFFQLIRDLATKGGKVAKLYVNGQRKRFFPPLNFFLLVAAFHVFILNHGGDIEKSAPIQQQRELLKITDPVQREHLAAAYERKNHAIEIITKYGNIVSMIVVPITALFFWLFYYRRQYNYTENLIACMYMHAFVILIYGILLWLNNMLFKLEPNIIYIIFFLMQITYYPWFYYRFQGSKGTKGAIKAFVSSFLSVFLLFLLNWILMAIYMLKVFG